MKAKLCIKDTKHEVAYNIRHITRIPSFSNYALWLKDCFLLNKLYVLTKGQSTKWHGSVLTNQFDYDD
jgi:hypothetical protein